MPINKSTELQALKTGIQAAFNKGLQSAADYTGIAFRVKSTTARETYGWLDDFPDLAEWVSGTIPLSNVKERAFVLENKKYARGLKIEVTDLEDDAIGHYSTIGQRRGTAVVNTKNNLLATVINSGETQTCFDGQFFFDVDHPLYPNADGTGTATMQANLIAGTATGWYLVRAKNGGIPFIFQDRIAPEIKDSKNSDTETITTDSIIMSVRMRCAYGYGFWQDALKSKAALTKASFEDAYEKMMTFKGHGGRPLGIVPDTLVVPPSLWSAAKEIVSAKTLSGGGENTNAGLVELVVNPYLT